MRRAACAAALAFLLTGPAAGETVQIPGPEGPLEGELVLPEGARAGVVIVPGSGPIDRDGNGPDAPGLANATKIYALLAEGLASEGLASLRIDKRGLFGSRAAQADPEAVTIADYAEDVGGWARFMAARLGQDCVWLAGHSEGGLVVLAAALEADPCGLILLAAPGRRLSVILREQLARQPGSAPWAEEMERVLTTLEAGRRVDVTTLSPALRQPWRDSIQGFLIDLFSYDPLDLARAYDGPVLVVQGDLDVQITPVDARALAEAAPGAELRLFPGMTHMLRDAVVGEPYATYTRPDLPLTPGLTEAIAGFIR